MVTCSMVSNQDEHYESYLNLFKRQLALFRAKPNKQDILWSKLNHLCNLAHKVTGDMDWFIVNYLKGINAHIIVRDRITEAELAAWEKMENIEELKTHLSALFLTPQALAYMDEGR